MVHEYNIGMYIRETNRKNKDGSVTTYVQIAHNEWDSDRAFSTTKVLYNLGRKEDVDREGLQRLVNSVNRFLGPEAVIRQQHGDQSIKLISGKPIGGVWVLDQLWKNLNIDTVIGNMLKKRNYSMPVERAIFAMAANRALNPCSKLGIEGWVRNVAYVPDLAEIPVHSLYRAMDFLLESSEELQKSVFFEVANLMNIEVDLLYFDTTSTYFEVENEDNEDDTREHIRKLDNSKDLRPDLPQVVIGLAVTREGIPVCCWCWPGNTADMSVVEEIKKDLMGWKLGRVISVMDRGFSSEDNLRALQRGGGHYIVGEKMRSGKAVVDEALSRKGWYKVINDRMEIKEIVVGNGEARTRFVMLRNPMEAEKDRKTREKHLERIKEELAAIGELSGGAYTKRVCNLVSHEVYGRYLKLLKNGQSIIDKAKIKSEENLDGKYLIQTSDDTLSSEDVAIGYKQLMDIESAFRTIKQTLELRPIYHRLSDRIRAHVLLCWLALLLIRTIENKTDQNWLKVRANLERMQAIEYETQDGRIIQRTETDTIQRNLFKVLNIKEPAKILALWQK